MSANKHQGEAYEDADHGWYKEPRSCVEQLFDAVDFGDSVIWDCCAGSGNILDVAKDRGHSTIASDIVDRHPRHPFYRSNFLMAEKWPNTRGKPLSIVSNPPFNTPPGSGLNIIMRAIERVPFQQAAFIMPLEFLCGQERHATLFSKHPPAIIAYCSQRPSMPPGKEIEAMGDKAFKGGKADFAWLVWINAEKGVTYTPRSIWLTPDSMVVAPKSERRIRRG